MKPAVYFLWLFCVAVFTGAQVRAGSSLLSGHSLSSAAKLVKPASAHAFAECKTAEKSQPSLTLDDTVAVDDDEDDQDQMGKHVPVSTVCDLVFALHALPPPTRASSVAIPPAHLSFLCACRYIAQRALLI